MNKMFQENLVKYLKGYQCDTLLLAKELRNFKNCIYDGYVFRGMAFSHPVDKYDVKESDVCSWSSNLEVAMNFASKGKHHLILIKESSGISIGKLIGYLEEIGELEDNLSQFKNNFEYEVIDTLYINDCQVLQLA